MRLIAKGATSQRIYFEVKDSTSTTGGLKTGLAFNTAGLTAYYVRNGGLATAITLATLAAADSGWSSGGFKEVDATNMPGIYRLDVPNAALASGAESVVVTLKGATGMVQVSEEVQLGLDALLDQADAIETGWTLRMVLRVGAAALAGILSGAGTTTITFRNITNTKDRIVATVDATGNRSAISLDGS